MHKNIKELKKNGITILNNQISNSNIKKYKLIFEKILNDLKKKGVPINPNCTLIRNPYRHDERLANLIYNKNVDKIISEFLGKDHIMVNSTIINRKLSNDIKKIGPNMGDKWHTDSHYLNGRRIEKHLTFIVITLFDDFNKENGSTFYIPSTHNKKNAPSKKKNYKLGVKNMEAKAGSIIIMDGGVWHKGGIPSDRDRWTMFTYYAPWFFKPYFRFPEMMGKKFGKKVNKSLRRLFHYNSTPPLNEEESIYTLRY